MNKIEEALTDYWGEKCDCFDKNCPCCQAWQEYKEMLDKARFYDIYVKQ
jgi:hypothetical protein